MSYQVKIEKVAVKQLKKIPNPDYNRLKTAILALSNDPRPAGYKKLKGRSGYRIRVGNYRVIYEIKEILCEQRAPPFAFYTPAQILCILYGVPPTEVSASVKPNLILAKPTRIFCFISVKSLDLHLYEERF